MPGDVPTFHRGWRPGLIGETAAAHARYYAAHWNFGAVFEAKVAAELAALMERYDPSRDLTLSAWEGERLLGTVTVNGSDPANPPNHAHLRWFIVVAPGRGLGRLLLAEALAFVDGAGFEKCFLDTFVGLDAARHLYEGAGFRLVSETEDTTWGTKVTELRFERG